MSQSSANASTLLLPPFQASQCSPRSHYSHRVGPRESSDLREVIEPRNRAVSQFIDDQTNVAPIDASRSPMQGLRRPAAKMIRSIGHTALGLTEIDKMFEMYDRYLQDIRPNKSNL
jgi:hypothetical protein